MTNCCENYANQKPCSCYEWVKADYLAGHCYRKKTGITDGCKINTGTGINLYIGGERVFAASLTAEEVLKLALQIQGKCQ